MRMTTLCLLSLTFYAAAFAECRLDEDDLETLVGYRIEAIKTIAGWVDEDAGEVGNADDWEGCRYGRKIIFEDGTNIICNDYAHSSAWGEQVAILFTRSSDTKICVDDELMDVRTW